MVDQQPTDPTKPSKPNHANAQAAAGDDQPAVIRAVTTVLRAGAALVRAVTGTACWLINLWRQADQQTTPTGAAMATRPHLSPRSGGPTPDVVIAAESQRREGEGAALERQRIARDLHDSVSQSLFSTTLHVRTAQHALELEKLDTDGPVGEELSEIGLLTRGALAEMRALIFELQPGALAEEGLVAALAKQASALSAREGLVIEVDGPDERLPIGAGSKSSCTASARKPWPTWSNTPGQPAPRSASPQPTTPSRSR